MTIGSWVGESACNLQCTFRCLDRYLASRRLAKLCPLTWLCLDGPHESFKNGGTKCSRNEEVTAIDKEAVINSRWPLEPQNFLRLGGRSTLWSGNPA